MSPAQKYDGEQMIGLAKLGEILETVIWSAALANSIPTSIIIVGEPGTGKSKTLLQFDAVSLHVTNDMTTAGLFDALERDHENRIRHILFPDINALLSHKASTSGLMFGNLLALMSEGVIRIDDGRKTKEIPHAPVGILAAATPEMFAANAKKWQMTGFKRRFIPLFFEYQTATLVAINKSIRNGKTTLKQLPRKKIALPPIKATIAINETLGLKIESLAGVLASNLAWYPAAVRDTTTGKLLRQAMQGRAPITISPHLLLRNLAMAHAVKNRRAAVNEADYDFLTQLIDFTKYGSPVKL